MTHKALLLILLAFIVKIYPKEPPIKLIFENRNHIITALNNLNFGESFDDSTPSKYYYFDKMSFNLFNDSSYTYWKKNEEQILTEFLYSFVRLSKKYKTSKYYIDDSITISILCSFLEYPDYRNINGVNWVKDAYNYLLNETYFEEIERHKENIIERLSRCMLSENDKLSLLVLCGISIKKKKNISDSLENLKGRLSKSFDSLEAGVKMKLNEFESGLSRADPVEYKKSLRKHTDSLNNLYGEKLETIKIKLDEINSIPLWVKARLGDTLSYNKIIEGLNGSNGNLVIYSLKNASFLWTEKCKEIFFTQFNRDLPLCPVVEGNRKDYQICHSLQDSMFVLLARHHPGDPMFGRFLSASRKNADFCNIEKQVQYFHKFASWAKDKYGYKLNYSGFNPYFIKDIGKNKTAISELCKDSK